MSELSHEQDKHWGLLGVFWHAVSGDYEQRFYWADASKWGDMHVKHSQLQPSCHTEIRREEEVFIELRLPVALL